MTVARGIRNRNPGNIVVSGWTQRQQGYLGPEPEGRFARFDTMSNGVLALIRLLLVYRDQHKLKTVRQIINRWAPPVENDTGSYVMSVAKVLGVGIDDELPADPQVYAKLARAIVGHENGREAAAAVTDEDYDQAMVAAFMLPQGPASSTTDATVSAPPAPAPSIKDKIMAAPALVLAAAQALIPFIADLMRERGSKTATRNADILERAPELVPTIIELGRAVVPDAANEQQIVERITESKDLQAQLRAQAAMRWSDIRPFLEFEAEERGRAREFARTWDGDRLIFGHFRFVELLSLLLVVIAAGGGWMVLNGEYPAEMKGAVITLILISGFTGVKEFWLGSSRDSQRKTELMSGRE